MHTFKYGKKYRIHHNNESHPASLVTVSKTNENGETVELEVPFALLAEFVGQQFQRDAIAKMESQSCSEWLRDQLNAPRR